MTAAVRAQVLERALTWLMEQREFFDPDCWRRYLPPRRFGAAPLLELLVLLRCLRRAGLPHTELAEFAYPLAAKVCGGAEFRTGLRRLDATFPYHAYLTCLLHEHGEPSPIDEIESIVESGCGEVFAPDRPALTRLELAYVLRIGGISPGVSEAHLYSGSVAATRATPLFLAVDEIYAFTHALFYVTNFGRELPGWLDEHERARLREFVLVLLGARLCRGDLDLAGELLLCATAVGLAQHELSGHGWQRIAEWQRADGAVPSPLHDPARESSTTGMSRRAYVFGTCFHTTMVAAMAGAGDV